MESTKQKVKSILDNYIKVFPNEYEAFKKGMSVKEDLKADTWGQVKGADSLDRKLGEMPETLWSMLVARLTPEEMSWMKGSKANPKKTGLHWFYKTYKDFRYTKDI